MQSYGTTMNGSFVVEKVINLPQWSLSDIGRFLYDCTTNNYFLGAPLITVGQDGWIPLGITTNIIKAQNIDWDVELSNRLGGVSAKDVPAAYKLEPSTVQAILDTYYDTFELIRQGKFLSAGSITAPLLKIEGQDKISAKSIPILNETSLFKPISGSTITIEDALTILIRRSAEKINLDTSGASTYGDNLNFKATTIQGAFEELEQYLVALTADDIPCTYEGCSCETNVQFVIDALYKLYSQIKIIDLVDTPDAYDDKLFYLKSNGVDKLEWSNIVANDVEAQYPGTDPSNVQYAIWTMEGDIKNIIYRLDTLKLHAKDIKYEPNSTQYVFDNVDTALNTIFTNFYSPKNKPTATDISCIAMGGPANINVQLVLAYLDSQLNTLLSSLPCSVGAANVSYASASGATNVANTLTYILSFIDYMRSTGTSYAPFVP